MMPPVPFFDDLPDTTYFGVPAKTFWPLVLFVVLGVWGLWVTLRVLDNERE